MSTQQSSGSRGGFFAGNSARLLSINSAVPRDEQIFGSTVATAIFKESRSGTIAIRTLNIDGDSQANLRVHGGVDKAVYAYPVEHYSYWCMKLDLGPLAYGAFGENLTLSGVLEEEISIGDRLRIGTALLEVAQPRIPCFKLAHRLGQPRDFVARFLASGRTGFYLRVLEEGAATAGDPVQVQRRTPAALSVAQYLRATAPGHSDIEALRRACAAPRLAESALLQAQRLLQTMESKA